MLEIFKSLDNMQQDKGYFEEEELNEPIIDITKPFSKPGHFDELIALSNHYQDMETIIESLQKHNSVITIDEDPNNDDADKYDLDPPYKTLIIEMLKEKMSEIRDVLGFN